VSSLARCLRSHRSTKEKKGFHLIDCLTRSCPSCVGTRSLLSILGFVANGRSMYRLALRVRPGSLGCKHSSSLADDTVADWFCCTFILSLRNRCPTVSKTCCVTRDINFAVKKEQAVWYKCLTHYHDALKISS